MSDKKSIEELVALADENGSIEGVSQVICLLYETNDEACLNHTIRLALSDYGGITFKSDFQNLGFLGVLHWGLHGLKKLGERVIQDSSFRSLHNLVTLLTAISSKKLDKFPGLMTNLECIKRLSLSDEKYKDDEWTLNAKAILVDVVKSVKDDEVFPSGLVLGMQFNFNPIAQEHIFAAMMARWFNINEHGLNEYLSLINKPAISEIECQNFLKINSYILEPFHAQIWSKPRFGEKFVPDFLIRSMDDSYTVIEIERPDIKIMTKSGDLSHVSSHAKRQALEFRDWAINNHLYARSNFPGLYRPICLVVIGMESDLDEAQLERLRQENESTQGVLKIVGFDWFFKRAKATFDNLVKYGFERTTFKETISDI